MVAVANSNGVIQKGYKYRAYGEATVLTDAGNDGTWFTSDDTTDTKSAIDNPYTFTGRRCDSETGLYYFRNRIYRSDLGIFLSRDPMGYGSGMRLLEYCESRATFWTDPMGLNPLRWIVDCIQCFRLSGKIIAAEWSAECRKAREEACEEAGKLGDPIKAVQDCVKKRLGRDIYDRQARHCARCAGGSYVNP